MSDVVLLSVYGLLLFSSSLLALGWVAKRWLNDREAGEIHPMLPPWWLRPVDFALWIAVMMLWFVFASTLAKPLASLAGGLLEEDAATIWATLASGMLLQLGMLVSFLYVRKHFSGQALLVLSPRPRSAGKAAFLGLITFLAAYPLIVLVNLIWTFFTSLLRSLGLEIPMDPQPVVGLLLERDEFWIWPMVFVLAVIIAPVVEELVFRAGIFRFLQGRFSMTAAVLISSVLFGLVHGHFMSLPGLTMVGVALAIAYHRTGDIRVPIIFHALFNFNSLLLLRLFPEITF